jgi:hypothetical protein
VCFFSCVFSSESATRECRFSHTAIASIAAIFSSLYDFFKKLFYGCAPHSGDALAPAFQAASACRSNGAAVCTSDALCWGVALQKRAAIADRSLVLPVIAVHLAIHRANQ